MGFAYGFDSAFGVVSGLMQFLIPLVFVVTLGIIVVIFVRGIGEWNKNNHAPRLTVPAHVVSRRTAVSHHHHSHGDGMHHMDTDTSYYVTFQVDSGDRMEFPVSGREYGLLAEGDRGSLTFQGTRYLNFTRQGQAD